MSNLRIRVSTLPSYFDCPRRAIARTFRRLIEDEGYKLNPLITGVAPVLGTAIHAGTGHILENKKNTGVPANMADGEEVAILNFRDGIKEGVEWDATTPRQNDGEKQIRIINTAYYKQVQPKIMPVALEIPMKANLGDGFILSGHADILTAIAVRDTKTGTRVSDYQSQIGGYSLLAKSNGQPKKYGYMDFLPRVPLNKPYPGAREIVYDLKIGELTAHNITMRMKLEVQNFIQTKEAWRIPANPLSMLCSKKYCPAHGTEFCELCRKKGN